MRIFYVNGKAISVQPWIGPKGYRRLRPPGFPDSGHMKVVRLWTLGSGRLHPPPPPQEGARVPISVKAESTPGQLYGWKESMQNLRDRMGNRARDLPAFGAVPQSAARPDPLPSIINTLDIRNFIYFFLKQTAPPLCNSECSSVKDHYSS